MNRKVIPKQPVDERVIEQIGSYDPLPNKYNEKMVAINYERLRYWISRNAKLSHTVAELLGLCGFLPIYPQTVMSSKRNRAAAAKKQAELDKQKSDEQTTADSELNLPQS